MIVGMVDDRALRLRQRASGRQPRPTPQPVAPTPSSRLNEVARVALGMNPFTGTSQADRDASTGFIQRHGAMDALLAPASSLVEDFADAGYAPSTAAGRFGLGAAAFGADVLNPVGWAVGAPIDKAIDTGIAIKRGVNALGDAGVVGANRFVMAAADPAGAQAARNVTEADLMQNPQGLYAAILRNLARHRSKNPYLGLGVKRPENVEAITGRAGGPGTYFGQSQQASDDAYSGFGENVYRIREPFTEVWDTVRNSPGYVTPQDLIKLQSDNQFLSALMSQQRINRDKNLAAQVVPGIGNQTMLDEPLIQDLISRGYKGYKYADDAFTDWTVGAKPLVGLTKVSGPNISRELINDFTNKARYELQDPNNPVNRFLLNPINDARTGINRAVDTVVRQPIRAVRDARSASQEAYQRALSQYDAAEGAKLAEMFGPSYGASSVLRPPAPPGYVASTAPQQPGAFDFLQYLFNTQR